MEGTRQQRRLATILAADVVGYSGHMARDEEATVRTLRSHRQVIDGLIARHEGRIFNTAGDSVLAEFGSAVEAVRCALTIQDELRVRNAELVPDRQLLLRIGVNVGDVLVEGDDLLGDGVNIAARLEGLAQPGGICISASTFEQVKNKLSVGFEDLGPQQVKNIPEPVRAFGITAAPVTVAQQGDAARSLRWPVAAGSALVLLAVIGGAAYWYFGTHGPASIPATITTDEMRADQIAAFMTGVTIRGTRRIDGQPFTIVLNADKTASYEFPRAGAANGTTEHITGTWRASDFRFCMQIKHFGQGRELCPRIEKDGAQVIARGRRNGQQLPWTLTK
jgi:adenylate cyclase